MYHPFNSSILGPGAVSEVSPRSLARRPAYLPVFWDADEDYSLTVRPDIPAEVFLFAPSGLKS